MNNDEIRTLGTHYVDWLIITVSYGFILNEDMELHRKIWPDTELTIA